MAKSNTCRRNRGAPKCLDVQSWRLPTMDETLAWLESKKPGSGKRSKPSALMVRRMSNALSTVFTVSKKGLLKKEARLKRAREKKRVREKKRAKKPS